MLQTNQISGGTVPDRDGRLVAVVSTSGVIVIAAAFGDDLLAAVDSDYHRQQIASLDTSGVDIENNDNTQVRDIMSTTVISAGVDTSVGEIVSIVNNDHIHRIIITAAGSLVCVVCRMNILKAVIDGRLG